MSNFKVIRLGSDDRKRFCPSFDVTILENTSLSVDARFMLVYLLSRGPGWNYNQTNIERLFHWGKNKVSKVSMELQAAGYFNKEQLRQDAGRLGGYGWTVYERPKQEMESMGNPPNPENEENGSLPNPDFTEDGSPNPDFTEAGKTGAYKEQLPIKNNGINNNPSSAEAEGEKSKPKKSTEKKNKQASNPKARKVVAYLIDKLKEQGARGSEFDDKWLFPGWAIADKLLRDYKVEELMQAIDYLCGQTVYPARNMADIQKNLSVWRQKTKALAVVGHPQAYDEIDPIFKGAM